MIMRAPSPVAYRAFRRGLGQPLVPVPAYVNCSPLDTACVQANQVLSNTYNQQLQLAQAQNNFNQCQVNANNANSQSQFDAMMAACGAQAATQSPNAPVVSTVTPIYPQSPAPPQTSGVTTTTVVNPSPKTQPATTGSSSTSPASTTSVASGGTAPPTTLTSLVAGYVPTNGTATTADWISGIPNTDVVVAGVVLVALLMLGGKKW